MTSPAAPPDRPIRRWQDAEVVAARWMQWLGYADARCTPGGADGGLDVQAKDAVGQVKWLDKAVGRPDIQRLVGAATGGGRSLFFFSRSGYSKHAIEWANQHGIACFQLSERGNATPMNPVASRLFASARSARAAAGGWTDPALITAHQVALRRRLKWAFVLSVAASLCIADSGGSPWWGALLIPGALVLAAVDEHRLQQKALRKRQPPKPPRSAVTTTTRTATPVDSATRPSEHPQTVVATGERIVEDALADLIRDDLGPAVLERAAGGIPDVGWRQLLAKPHTWVVAIDSAGASAVVTMCHPDTSRPGASASFLTSVTSPGERIPPRRSSTIEAALDYHRELLARIADASVADNPDGQPFVVRGVLDHEDYEVEISTMW